MSAREKDCPRFPIFPTMPAVALSNATPISQRDTYLERAKAEEGTSARNNPKTRPQKLDSRLG